MWIMCSSSFDTKEKYRHTYRQRQCKMGQTIEKESNTMRSHTIYIKCSVIPNIPLFSTPTVQKQWYCIKFHILETSVCHSILLHISLPNHFEETIFPAIKASKSTRHHSPHRVNIYVCVKCTQNEEISVLALIV